MRWKELFKPRWINLLTIIILFIFSWFYKFNHNSVADSGGSGRGFPFPIYGETISFVGSSGMHVVFGGIVLDLLTYYLVSLIVVFVYYKIKKK